MKKNISIVVPCYNEKDNIIPLVNELKKVIKNDLSNYNVKIMFIDNDSNDGTRELIREVCEKEKDVRAIFNARNFAMTSGYYGLLQAGGDCTISIPADFQIPLDIIPKLVKEWEDGGVVVCAVKESSHDNKLMWWIRQCFYKLYLELADGQPIKNFTGSGLYDKKFIDILREMNDNLPSLMSVIMTHGWNLRIVKYYEQKRRSGKSHNNLIRMINIGILRITNTSVMIPRLSITTGFGIAIVSFLSMLIYLIISFIFGRFFVPGIIPTMCGVFFIGSLQLIFLGLMGEYIIKINARIQGKPLVIENERIGDWEDDQSGDKI